MKVRVTFEPEDVVGWGFCDDIETAKRFFAERESEFYEELNEAAKDFVRNNPPKGVDWRRGI